jgi:3-oxoacyl-[acyl-carrier protein] reductase
VRAAPARALLVLSCIAAFAFLVPSDGGVRQRDAEGARRRAAHPWEVANIIVFLASDYASYLTGEVVSVSRQHS